MNLKSFIDYYPSCPLCQGNMVINSDLSIPSTIDKHPDGLLISIFEDENPKTFKLLYENRIVSEYPYIIQAPYNIIRRRILNIKDKEYDRLQLELSCLSCGRFKYWSSYLIFDQDQNISEIEIHSERLELKNKLNHFILSNNLKLQELKVYLSDSNISLPLIFKGTFKNLSVNSISFLEDIKKQIIIS